MIPDLDEYVVVLNPDDSKSSEFIEKIGILFDDYRSVYSNCVAVYSHGPFDDVKHRVLDIVDGCSVCIIKSAEVSAWGI